MKLLPATAAIAVLAAAPSFAQEVQGQFERTLSVSGPADLDVLTDAGGISVRQGSAGSVQIRGLLKGHRGRLFDSGDVERRIRALEQNPPIEQTGNRIRIGYVSNRDLLRNVSMRLEILTPATSRVRARADSGGIHVEGIQGPADCKTDSGGIEVFDIGSEVRATADSGGIHLRNIKGPVFARADSGGIEALDVAGSLDASTDSGGVRLGQTTPAPIRVRADSGGATLRLASSGGYDISIASDSGRISVPQMTVRGTMSPHRMEGKLRGGGPLVDIRVSSGNVSIE